MGKMSTAIINLIKSYFVRPVKPQNTTLHWVKADKPIDQMSPEERKEFSNTLADSMLKLTANQKHQN